MKNYIKVKSDFLNFFADGTFEEMKERILMSIHKEYLIVELPNSDIINALDFLDNFNELVSKFCE